VHDDLSVRLLLLACLIVVGSPAPALAAGGWAGITEAQAIARARAAVEGLVEAAKSYDFPTGKPMNAARVVHYVATVRPSVSRMRCNGKQVWKVAWPNSSPRIGDPSQFGSAHVPAIVVSKSEGADTVNVCKKPSH